MDNQNHSEEKKDKKKYLPLLILLLIFISLLTVTFIAAYYSDLFTKNGRVTAGTLIVNGDYTFYLNGVETLSDNITNLNPGDIIVVSGMVTNEGNKSAWVRDTFAFTDAELFLPYLEVYKGTFTQAQLTAGAGTGSLLRLTDNIAVSSNSVINGSGATGEIETGTNTGYNYLNDSAYQVSYTIYFLPAATNETQGQTFDFTVGVQALQFRNNNAEEPDETAWATVTPVPRAS